MTGDHSYVRVNRNGWMLPVIRAKKSRATNVPGKFIREASRLGDVGF